MPTSRVDSRLLAKACRSNVNILPIYVYLPYMHISLILVPRVIRGLDAICVFLGFLVNRPKENIQILAHMT